MSVLRRAIIWYVGKSHDYKNRIIYMRCIQHKDDFPFPSDLLKSKIFTKYPYVEQH